MCTEHLHWLTQRPPSFWLSAGSNSKGQLGHGNNSPRQLVPTPVQGAVTGIKFTAVDAGHHHVLAASKSGEVYCWGANTYGQLGLGDLEDRNVPHALLHKFTRSKVSPLPPVFPHHPVFFFWTLPSG